MKLLVSLLWLQPTHPYFLPESVAIAQPFWAWKWKETELPHGAEVLKQYAQGETLFVYLRIWDFAEEKRLIWGKDTLSVRVVFPELPPDSLMPQADMRIPQPPPPPPPLEEVPTWIGLVLAGLLAGLMIAPYLWKKGRRWLYELYLIARWHFWLWHWRKVQPQHFPNFISAVKKLLHPHASFHPGSLVLTELPTLQAPPPLPTILSHLLHAERRVVFLGQPLPPSEIALLWQQTHRTLRALGRRLRPGKLLLLKHAD